jgi:hypothetical protein
MKHIQDFEGFINESESKNSWVRSFAKSLNTNKLGDGTYIELQEFRPYDSKTLSDYPHLKGSAERWNGLTKFNVNFDGAIEFHETTGLKVTVNNPKWEAVYNSHLQDSGYKQHMQPEESVTEIIKEIKKHVK